MIDNCGARKVKSLTLRTIFWFQTKNQGLSLKNSVWGEKRHMKMLPQRSPKMLPELFEDTLVCSRIREKPERKFDGHNFNIKFEKLKLVVLSLIFGSGAPFWSPLVKKG